MIAYNFVLPVFVTLQKLTLDVVILAQELVYGRLHSTTNAVSVPLHQLDNALSLQEEVISIRAFRKRSGMTAYNTIHSVNDRSKSDRTNR